MSMWGDPAFICALLASAVLLRRMPLVALALALAGLAATSLAPKTQTPASALQVVVACAAGLEICYMAATRTRKVSVAGVAIAGAGLPLLALALPSPNPRFADDYSRSGTPVPLITIAVPLVMVIAWLIGNSIRQAQAKTELVRAQAATQSALAERLRIARELHDSVAHSVGIIAIQAGAGHRVFDTSPAQARDALAAIEATSRQTLSGLRQMVTGLRRADLEAGAGRAPFGPAPGLADVNQLAAMTLDAGVRVDVEWRGIWEPLPADIDLSAFRIIQEAVTNVVRHASAGECLVVIDQREGQLSIEVTDSGRGGPVAGPEAGTCYGITGMRERAALLGGDFSAGPRPGGGFRVTARLPVPAPAP